jgi:tRNA dimethylallyltransferase
VQEQKIIVIVGPTASGKSSLGVFLAQKVGGEVISADSRQVYKGLDTGTGKITKKEMAGVPHHLLDVANPKKVFSADDFVRLATKAIEKVSKKVGIPLVVGGTGFYIDTLFGRFTLPQVPPNPALRKKLAGKSAEQLFAMLKKLDPTRANNIDAKNPVRLIRAIEVALVKPSKRPGAKSVAEPVDAETLRAVPHHTLWIGLDPKDLKKRIHARVLSRIKAGMIAEAKRLHTNGLSYKRMHELGLEYRYLSEYLQKKISLKELEKIKRAIS